MVVRPAVKGGLLLLAMCSAAVHSRKPSASDVAAAAEARAEALVAAPADPLGALLRRSLTIARERMALGPPAFERLPELALRYRDYGDHWRHARGDAYPMYTLDTLRNLADHVFDWMTDYKGRPDLAAAVRPCDVVYSTLRPTVDFLNYGHRLITVNYLLITDTMDDSIRHQCAEDTIASSPKVAHWWAADNMILDVPKLESLPAGIQVIVILYNNNNNNNNNNI
jgi:hypothetical protein